MAGVGGTISWFKFKANIVRFVKHSEEIQDGWQYIETKDTDDEACFMKKHTTGRTRTKAVHLDTEHSEDESEDGMEDSNLAEDDQCILTPSTTSLYTCDYHILYSSSYGVPVLYFNFYHQDGRLFNLEEVWSMVPDVYQERLGAEKWTFITQQEHPILGRPFYHLHPCHTAELMTQNCVNEKEDCNYLVQWLSTIGPVVGLHLPLSYVQIGNG